MVKSREGKEKANSHEEKSKPEPEGDDDDNDDDTQAIRYLMIETSKYSSHSPQKNDDVDVKSRNGGGFEDWYHSFVRRLVEVEQFGHL